MIASYRTYIGFPKGCLLQSSWQGARLQGLQVSIYASPCGVSEETVRTVEDMVRDQGYTDGTLHISVVNVMFWINQNEYEFMKQIRSYV